MAKRRPVSNPLALAVLACLHERPMHPYEMASTLRERAKEHSIKLNYGSLYTVVDNLAKHGLIEAMAARREGRRPERTVYRLTGAGNTELHDWMSELLAEPVKEYPRFEAALSLLPVVPPGRVLTLLQDRVHALDREIADVRLLLDLAAKAGLPRLLLIEGEYHLVMREAELGWVRRLLADLEEGTLGGLPEWRHWHETGEPPQWDIDFSATAGTEATGGTGARGGKGGGATQA
jgi:DNA-binding PadR family transcriptional regulator